MSEDAIQKATDMLLEAYQTGKACAPVRDLLPEGDVDAAYAVQEINTERRLAGGARMVGRKIGLTSKLVQKQLGVDRPDFGILFADMAVPDGEEVDTSSLLDPRVEAEITYVLEKDIKFEKPTNSDVIDAIAYATPSIEIVDSRVKDWNIKIQDTVADNASAVLYVLGNQKVKIEDFDGRMCGMVMECRGEPVSVGAGAACLGHPANAVRRLAEEMVKRGRPLSAGDGVMSGALGPMIGVEAGQVYEVRINGLGSVRAAFAA